MNLKRRLLTFHPSFLSGYGIGHAALSIIESMSSSYLDCVLVVHAADKKIQSKNLKKIIPGLLMRGIYKLFSSNIIRRVSEFWFLHQVKSNDIVYLWPGSSIALFQRIKAKGNIIVIENINCHQKISKRILDDEAQRIGIQGAHLITQESIEDESEKLRLCDYVFSPSPMVTRSLIDVGLPTDKIIESSYGLHQYQQLMRSDLKSNKFKPLEVIFVGRVGLRKGIHLLLDYWTSANIEGTLKVVGNIEASMKDLIASYTNVKNIEFISFVSDIDKIYKNADIFVLPSLEEGSPLVTYLALGAGLPCIVSPMGGQGVITHNHDGFIIEPYDRLGWITALQNLSSSTEMRQAFSQAARESSNSFLWKKVGQKRATRLLAKLQGK